MDDIKRVQLSEIAELITKGTTPTTLGYEFQDNGINFLKIECFDEKGDFIKDKVTHISEECHEKLKRSQLKDGDILFSIAGAIGRVAIVTEEMLPANTNQALAIIRISDEEVYLPYIKLILTSPIVKEQFEKKKQGVAQLNLSLKDINEISIPLPNREKQIELTKLFEKVAGVIAKRNKEIKSLDDLIKARFVELFGDLASPKCKWKAEKLVDVCVNPDDIKCGPFGTQLNKDEYVDSGVAVWEIPQINSLFLTTPTHYLTEEKARQLDAYSIKPGDIAMSRKGNVGKCAVFPSSLAEGIIHSDVLRIRVDDSRVFPMFMMHQLHYSGAVQHQIELVSSGAIMAGINVTKLKQIFVHIPPMELQNQFTTFVQQVDKSKFLRSIYCDRLHIFMEQIKTILTPIGNYCFCRN